MSILVVYQLAKPDAQFFSNIGLSFALPYFSLRCGEAQYSRGRSV